MTLTVDDLITYIGADTTGIDVLSATPNSTSLTHMTRALEAAVTYVEHHYNVPATYPPDVELAILGYAAYLWLMRSGAVGMVVTEASAVRAYTPAHVETLLQAYHMPRFA